MDVRGFTLDGDYDIRLTPNVAYVGTYVINQNPRRIVVSNPGGYVDRENGESLHAHQGPGAFGGTMDSGAPAAGTLVSVYPGLMDDERLLEEEDDKKKAAQ
jgi:hypothetical protein